MPVTGTGGIFYTGGIGGQIHYHSDLGRVGIDGAPVLKSGGVIRIENSHNIRIGAVMRLGQLAGEVTGFRRTLQTGGFGVFVIFNTVRLNDRVPFCLRGFAV